MDCRPRQFSARGSRAGDPARGGRRHRCGEITLNYVAPDARFRGVSKALLRALEARARSRGNASVTLTSTQTALRLYLSAGYTAGAALVEEFGVPSYPMSKRLQPQPA